MPFQFCHFSSDYDSVKDEYIWGYASVFINGNFFIIGGDADRGQSSTIGRLDSATWSWSRAGQFNTARDYFRAIWVNSKLVVVGGRHPKPTEFCELENDEYTCTEQWSRLEYYYDYPLLFAVNDDYKNC